MNEDILDTKLQVLLAIYAEYQRDIPEMDRVTYKALDMDSQAFRAALIKLQNEGLISGLVIEPPNETHANKVRGVIRTNMLPTRAGLDEAEKYITTGNTDTAKSRLQVLVTRAGLAGLDCVKEIAKDVLADVIGKRL